MESDSYNRGSEINHSRGQKAKGTKAVGIQRQLSKEEYEREKAEIAVQLEVLMEMFQRNEENQKHGYVMRKKLRWRRLQEKWNYQVNLQLIKELRELEQVIDARQRVEKPETVELQQNEDAKEDVEVLLCYPESGPLLFESDEELEELNHVNDSKQPEDLVTEASNKTVRSCNFKTNKLCVIAGLEEEEEHLLKDVKEDLGEERPCEEMEDRVNFPKSTPSKIIELYRELDFQRRKLEEKRMNVHDRLLMKDEKAVVIKEITDDKQRNVAQGKEDWEAATFIVTARATCEATFIVAAAEKVQNSSKGEEQARMRVQQSRDGNNQQTEDILDRENELIRTLMINTSQRKIAERKKMSDNKRMTVKDCKSRASGALQHKIWKPGRQQQIATVVKQSTSMGRLQNKIWDLGGDIQTYDQVVMNFLTWGV